MLIHLGERAAALAGLAAQVRAGGVVAFAEPILASPPWLTRPRPLLSRSVGWVVEAMARAGGRPDMGLALPELFAEAGLPDPDFRVDGVPTVGADRRWFPILAGFVRSALPAIERLGVATAEEVDVDTLLDRLIAEGGAQGGAALAVCFGGAWTRPGGVSGG